MKRHHWRKFIASQEPNHAFEALKFTKIKSSSKVKPLRKQTGEITNDKKEQTELLFEMFAQAGKRADLSNIPEAPLALEKNFKKITLNKIKTSISQLPNKKAPGLDQIPNELLKILGNVLLDDLHKLFNAFLQIGYFPRHWKKASTIIIQKANKKDYSDPSAYRPIALLSTVADEVAKRAADNYLIQHYPMHPSIAKLNQLIRSENKNPKLTNEEQQPVKFKGNPKLLLIKLNKWERAHTLVIHQLQSAHSTLNHHLFRIRARGDPLCETCQRP
ncbi:hypothetical protein O181_001735 [Austropuccinia psidii MF-1]|uniref:Reverse transcriptase domain-containing protein n=1 Tax=Austropuccinia psidii MF-1 TaxID=1389203 RepID=A0A9Q3BB40_9BASI|nr:hypothetical protein [Austropuccinia psidii MF-1]